jgi:pimeloyl-ACP methyl ester carboxylesterase
MTRFLTILRAGLVVVCAAGLSGCAALAGSGASGTITPAGDGLYGPPPEPRALSIPTSDSGVVSAHRWGGGPRGVVLVPGGRFAKESWEPQARVLAAAGFHVLAMELRGRGESRAGAAGSDGYPLDVLAAVGHLRGLGVESVAVVAASLGGWAAAEAVVAAAPGEAVDRLVLLAHPPIDEPERLTPPTLFIVARDDASGTGALRLVAIRDQYQRAPGPKELVVLDGSAHAQFLFETDQAERLMEVILRFLSQ